MYKWRTGRWNAAPRLTFNVNSDTPPPKHKIRVRSMTTTGTSLERIPIHSVKAVEPSCIMAEEKPECPEKKLPHAPKWCKSRTPGSELRAPGEQPLPQPTYLTTLRVARQRLAPSSEEEWYRDAHRGPRTSRHTNASKSAWKIFTAILNESHRRSNIMTQICQRPRNGRNFDKNISTIIKMNASCTKCAIMKRRWIELAKISMNTRPAKFTYV